MPNKHILIVDDELDLVRVTSFRFRKLGYRVSTCFEGKVALEFIRKEVPDLVLLDLLLPQMSGDEICRYLKADERLRHIPIILFTATAVNISDKAKEIGADDYIAKPFSAEELVEKVKKFIG